MAGRERGLAPIVGLAYEFCAALYGHVNRFPRAQRTLLGRVILDEALRMLLALSRANRLADKREALAEASGRLDALRIALRLAKRLGFLSNPGYASLAETADEVGRMLGGWIRYERGTGPEVSRETEAQDSAPVELTVGEPGVAIEPTGASPAPPRGPVAPRKGAVRYTMQSPLVERYLNVKLAHPTAVCLLAAGAFCQAFFEDAQLVGRELGIAVRDLAADSESERIFVCGVPKARLGSSLELLGQAGWEVHVE